MIETLKIVYTIKLLKELREIYCAEGGKNFIEGIEGIIECLSETALEEKKWTYACSIYRTMADSKSGFWDIYIDGKTAEQRVNANARLDEIRTELWVLFCT